MSKLIILQQFQLNSSKKKSRPCYFSWSASIVEILLKKMMIEIPFSADKRADNSILVNKIS